MKNYETPQILELGDAEELTLGAGGCRVCDCDGGYIDEADDSDIFEPR